MTTSPRAFSEIDGKGSTVSVAGACHLRVPREQRHPVFDSDGWFRNPVSAPAQAKALRPATTQPGH